MSAGAHWERVDKTKTPDALSWYRPHLEMSLALVERAAEEVRCMRPDVTQVSLPRHSFDVWHDRVVFHFLTAQQHRAAYVQGARPTDYVGVRCWGNGREVATRPNKGSAAAVNLFLFDRRIFREAPSAASERRFGIAVTLLLSTNWNVYWVRSQLASAATNMLCSQRCRLVLTTEAKQGRCRVHPTREAAACASATSFSLPVLTS